MPPVASIAIKSESDRSVSEENDTVDLSPVTLNGHHDQNETKDPDEGTTSTSRSARPTRSSLMTPKEKKPEAEKSTPKTPRVQRPKKESSTPMGPVVITSFPETRTIQFPVTHPIVKTRAELLTLPEEPVIGAPFSMGDLIWFKQKTYPFWPCIITMCPITGEYCKQNDGEWNFHVQFFGKEAARDWTKGPSGYFLFDGLDDYNNRKAEASSSSSSSTPGAASSRGKVKNKPNKYTVEQKYRSKWDYSVAEAEYASSHSSADRIKGFTFTYIIQSLDMDTTRKRKVPEPSIAISSGKKIKKSIKKEGSPGNIFDFDDDEDDEPAPLSLVKETPLKLLSAKKKGDFDIYFKRESAPLSKEKPELDESALKTELDRKWNLMSDDQRGHYVNRDKKEVDIKVKSLPKTEPMTPKRRPGRPPKTPSSAVPKASTSKTVSPSKRGPGRPRKSESVDKEVETPSASKATPFVSPSSISPAKRARPGRPRKNEGDVTTEGNVTPKSNVSPKGVVTTPDGVVVKRKPGRPFKVKESPTDGLPITTKPPVSKVIITPSLGSPTKRGPGRPRKIQLQQQPQQMNGSGVTPKDVVSNEPTPSVQNNKLDLVCYSCFERIDDDDDDDDAHVVHQGDKDDDDLDELVRSERTNEKPGNKQGKPSEEFEVMKQQQVNVLNCEGPCGRTFCQECVNKGTIFAGDVMEPSPSTTRVCIMCDKNEHPCLVCGEATDDVTQCSESSCQKYYHLRCLQDNSYPFRMKKGSDTQFICPHHSCRTCFNESDEDNRHRDMKKKLLTCVMCPNAYHFMDECIAAGSEVMTHKSIKCPEHRPLKKNVTINVQFCFSCLEVKGQLVKCTRCPNSFHKSCLTYDVPDDGVPFKCISCIKMRQLLYNDIVWTKIGHFRWWPGKIIHPVNVPDNISKLPWDTGDFVVKFFGTGEYSWMHQGRTFRYDEDDTHTRIMEGKSNMDKRFAKGLEEAKVEFANYLEQKNRSLQTKTKEKPHYNKIRANKPIGQVVYMDRKGEGIDGQCDCGKTVTIKKKKALSNDIPLALDMVSAADVVSPPIDAPKEDVPTVTQEETVEEVNPKINCGEDSDCFNRISQLECNQKTCFVGKNCQNRRFTNRQYVKTEPFNTGARGWGLRSLEDINKDQFVIEYVGELIDEAECNKRMEQKRARNDGNFYFLNINNNLIIDAGPSGNLARFMNHSCDPNCVTIKYVVNQQTRVGLFARKDIPKGTELTFNYNFSIRGHVKAKCQCGSANCCGELDAATQLKGKDKKNKAKGDATIGSVKKPKKKSIKKRRAVQPSNHEDDCFMCDEGGELMLCDSKGCTKSYHLSCLNETKIPKGEWYCPYHHCDDCGKKSVSFCFYCPVSHCKLHQITFKQYDGKDACYQHFEDEDEVDDQVEQNGQDIVVKKGGETNDTSKNEIKKEDHNDEEQDDVPSVHVTLNGDNSDIILDDEETVSPIVFKEETKENVVNESLVAPTDPIGVQVLKGDIIKDHRLDEV